MFLLTVLQINFEKSDYSTVEGAAMYCSPIRLQFRTNQNPFNVTLSPVNIATAESQGLGFFINSGAIASSSRAIAGSYKCTLSLLNTFLCGILLGCPI